jgi:competence protein ComFB
MIGSPETAMGRKWYDDDELDILINRNHELVLDSVETYLEANAEFCRCRDCRLDLAALTLNRAPARYYVSEYHMRYYGEEDDAPIEKRIARVVNEAAAIVARRPHHD